LANTIEIRWHGRGGQGAITGAKTLAEMFIKKGKYVLSFPEFGPERRGAPVRAFNKISDDVIRYFAPVEKPDYIIVVDESLLENEEIKEGAKINTIFFINSDKNLSELSKLTGIPEKRIVAIPATKISMEKLKRNLPNMPILTAFIKYTGLLSKDEFIEEIKNSLEGKFAEDIIKANLEIVDASLKEVKSIEG